MTAFWETWAAWLTRRIGSFGVEVLSGVLLATVVQFAVDGWRTQALVSGCASGFYEEFIDPNRWSWPDFLQRAVGIALGLWGWALLR